MSEGETFTCQDCSKKVTYRDDRYFLADGTVTDGAWCHGTHETPYFMCADHFATMSTSQHDLPLTYCWLCVLKLAKENMDKKQ